MDLTGATGLILYVMHVSATDSAATMPLRRSRFVSYTIALIILFGLIGPAKDGSGDSQQLLRTAIRALPSAAASICRRASLAAPLAPD